MGGCEFSLGGSTRPAIYYNSFLLTPPVNALLIRNKGILLLQINLFWIIICLIEEFSV